MKVLIVNTYDKGGAANACLRLHKALLNNGINSKVLLKENDGFFIETYSAKKKVQLTSFNKFIKKIVVKIFSIFFLQRRTINNSLFKKNRDPRLELFTYPDSNFDITETDFYKEADIINLHWVANFLDYSTFFRKNTKPVVWTLHDMNPFSGGEHYIESYLGMNKKGYPKKRKISPAEIIEFENVIEIKKRALKNCKNLNIITLCNWMKNEVNNSELFKDMPKYLIPNGIDSNIFKPRNIFYSRDLLSLPLNKKIILFVADSITNHRKGYEYLLEALKKVKNENLLLCTVGSKNNDLNNTKEIIELGHINNEHLMSAIYSAVDVFVIPSIMDNLPNTVIESIMCGTPVIGFPVGGIEEMIVHGENGYLTNEISVQGLSETISMFLKNTNFFNREKIRINAIKKYDSNIQVSRYIDLFKEISLNKIKK